MIITPAPRPGPAVLYPAQSSAPTAGAWPAANRALFARFCLDSAASFRYINWTCDAQSGNVQVGVVSLSGVGRTTYTPVVTSGVIACPAVAAISTDLGVFSLPPGDYALFMWADNTTFQTRRTTSSIASLKLSGLASSLSSGVIAAGTITWSSSSAGLALEADV